MTTTIVAHASARGIEVDSVHVEADGDLDLRGFPDLSDDVRKGDRQLRLAVSIRANLRDADVAAFVRSAIRFSPVLDLFRNGADVVVELG